MIGLDAAFALFDDGAGGALLLEDCREEAVCSAADDPAAAFAAIEAGGQWCVLLADYALAQRFEPALPPPPSETVVLRSFCFARARRLDAAAVDAFLATKLAALAPAAQVAGVAEVQAALDAPAYEAALARIRRWIVEGDCYQINFTFPLAFTLYGDPLALYAALRRRQPVAYGGCLFAPSLSVLSFSPELFFERRGARVTTRPMKGTAPRGADAASDVACRDELLASAKERAENVMIVDLLRNDLGRLAAPGAVRVDALFVAEAYPTLWQMVSTVSADLPRARLGELFAALFPCGSVTGAPKLRAMQLIGELETSPRGLYTGAFGWLAPDGDCRFNVAIRTLLLDARADAAPAGGRRVRFGVGSGVVSDADARREYAECLLKASFLTGFDPGFVLIETLRLQPATQQTPGIPAAPAAAAGDYVFPLLARHLARLATSARALGFACDVPAVAAALRTLAATPGLAAAPLWRVRVQLAHDGGFALSHAPLAAAVEEQFAVIADERLASDDYLLRHKTSARERYERALAALPPPTARAAWFDAIFLNERGEVCEGARSSVFVERDGLLLTPPLRCGLLPGVLRAELLAQGRAVERVLTRADLRDAEQVFLGNALRGLLRVRVVA